LAFSWDKPVTSLEAAIIVVSLQRKATA